MSNILSKTLKSQLCGSLLVFVLQLACNEFHGALTRWTRNWHHYFCHSFHHICCDVGWPTLPLGPSLACLPLIVHGVCLDNWHNRHWLLRDWSYFSLHLLCCPCCSSVATLLSKECDMLLVPSTRKIRLITSTQPEYHCQIEVH